MLNPPIFVSFQRAFVFSELISSQLLVIRWLLGEYFQFSLPSQETISLALISAKFILGPLPGVFWQL
jgi:hypothetical protein